MSAEADFSEWISDNSLAGLQGPVGIRKDSYARSSLFAIRHAPTDSRTHTKQEGHHDELASLDHRSRGHDISVLDDNLNGQAWKSRGSGA